VDDADNWGRLSITTWIICNADARSGKLACGGAKISG
jgi:hypothetical protein